MRRRNSVMNEYYRCAVSNMESVVFVSIVRDMTNMRVFLLECVCCDEWSCGETKIEWHYCTDFLDLRLSFEVGTRTQSFRALEMSW